MCLTDELYRDTKQPCDDSPFLSSYDCASVHLFLQSRYGMTGLATTINTACSSSANAIQYGARLIRNGLAATAIVGGADSLAKFTINGFHALQILSTAACRPFDRDRAGLNLGEGAAFLVLDGEETLAGKKVYAELTGYCNTNDAFHPSALSLRGDGPYLAMEGALRSAGLKPTDIDFINTHGTATENNDEAEGRAMLRLFGELPPFGSTKSYTGHTLGAAGAIEAVYSLLSIGHQELYASLNFDEPIPDLGLRPVQTYQRHAVRHAMSNSFGFGGNCTSLIFSNVN
jgi:3-oxoacyl-(acyl-carrier-protein) synthase